MNAETGFPIDILIFGIVAAVLIFRLRGILGRRDGFEAKKPAAVIDIATARPQAAAPPPVRVPEPGTPLERTLLMFQSLEPTFDPARFVLDAQAAFRIIVLAFARGDTATLAQLLGPSTGAAFEAAIAERQRAGHHQHAEILEITHADIQDAALEGRQAHVTVKFTSEQVTYTTDDQGQIVTGHDGRTVIDDIWTFERSLGSPDPTWRLIAAHTA
jgi:predicted lipid-binding transport protein (Tim44 family)